jgi:hypothetical protein
VARVADHRQADQRCLVEEGGEECKGRSEMLGKGAERKGTEERDGRQGGGKVGRSSRGDEGDVDVRYFSDKWIGFRISG